MRLTAPAMASLPYTAEEPTGRTSMRSMAVTGMELRSKKPSMPVSTSRPFNRTSVVPAGKPCSRTVVGPRKVFTSPSTLFIATSGSELRNSVTVVWPLRSMSSSRVDLNGLRSLIGCQCDVRAGHGDLFEVAIFFLGRPVGVGFRSAIARALPGLGPAP